MTPLVGSGHPSIAVKRQGQTGDKPKGRGAEAKEIFTDRYRESVNEERWRCRWAETSRSSAAVKEGRNFLERAPPKHTQNIRLALDRATGLPTANLFGVFGIFPQVYSKNGPNNRT